MAGRAESRVKMDIKFKCMECGRKFFTTRAAEKAFGEGCPKCGGVDVDEDVERSTFTAAIDAEIRELRREEEQYCSETVSGWQKNPVDGTVCGYPLDSHGQCPECDGVEERINWQRDGACVAGGLGMIAGLLFGLGPVAVSTLIGIVGDWAVSLPGLIAASSLVGAVFVRLAL